MSSPPTPGEVMCRLAQIARWGYLTPRAFGWLCGWFAACLMRGLPPPYLYPLLGDTDALSVEWRWQEGGWCPSVCLYLDRPGRPRTYVHLFDDSDLLPTVGMDACFDAEPDLTGPTTTRLLALVQGALS